MTNQLSTPPLINNYSWLAQDLRFQRSELTLTLLKSLLDDQLVMLMGPQGNGKRTLAAENLRWLLEEGDINGLTGNDEWRIVETRPFADPLGNLINTLSAPGVLFNKGEKDFSFREEVASFLKRDSYGLIDLYHQISKEHPKPINLLLIVDQQQDFFRYQDYITDGQDEQYLKLMTTAAREEVPIYVLFITDEEHLSYFSRYRGIPEIINNYRFELPVLPAEEISDQLTAFNDGKALPEFLNKTVASYDELLKRKDKFALPKLMHFLRYTYFAWQQEPAVEQKILLSTFFEDNLTIPNRLFYTLNYQMEDLYHRLGEGTKEEERLKQIAAFLFTSLCERGTGNQVLARPVPLNVLQQLVSRDEPKEISRTELFQIINHFNGQTPQSHYPHHFIDITQHGGQILSNESLVDFTSNLIPGTWWRLRKWADEESVYANIYTTSAEEARTYIRKLVEASSSQEAAKSLVRESRGSWRIGWQKILSFFKGFIKKAAPQETESEEITTVQDHLLSGARLAGAIHWLEKGHPSEVWAQRYPLQRQTSFNPEEIQLLKSELREQDENKLSDLKIARWFVQESKDYDDAEQEKEKADNLLRIKQANKQRRLAFILAAAASVSLIVGMVYLYMAKEAQRNLELVNMVDILNINNILDKGPEHKLIGVERLQVEIAQNKEIKTRQDVLDTLAAKGYLLVSKDDTQAKLGFRALLSIDQLYNELQQGYSIQKGADFVSGSDLSPSTWELLQVYQDARQAPPSQHPYLYYALAAQLKVLRKEETINYSESRSLIEDLASNPENAAQYAYGDRNGLVMIAEQTLENWSEEPYEQWRVAGTISALAYNLSGTELFIGVREGILYRLHNVLQRGEKIDSTQLAKFEGAISQILPYGDDQLFIRTSKTIYLINASTGKYIDTYPIDNLTSANDLSIGSSGERQFAILSGRHHSLVLNIDLDNKKSILQERFRINHKNITIFRTALKTYPDHSGKSWLFLGSETGSMWYTDNYQQLLADNKDVDIENLASFRKLQPRPHTSSITSLEFNNGSPQLASASLDGTMQFWNLEKLEDRSEQINLKNNGQGIWDLCYINENQVVIAENINTQTWHTSIIGQFEELKRLLCKDKLCNDANE